MTNLCLHAISTGLLGLGLVAWGGCWAEGPDARAAGSAPQTRPAQDSNPAVGHEGHDEPAGHDEHKGHAHGSPRTYDAAWARQVDSLRCEHELPTIDCDECRYELGVVQVSEALLDPSKDALIATGRVESAPASRAIWLTGEVAFDAGRVAHIRPRIEGLARRVFVELGDRVQIGARLVEMDSLELGRLRSDFLQARARMELARQDHLREAGLFDKRISSARELAQARSALRKAEISLQASRQQLLLLDYSEQELDQLGATEGAGAGRMNLRAPLAGEVVGKHAVPGERLTPDESVFVLADLEVVWVWADVIERDLAAVLAAAASKPAAFVQVAAFGPREFAGRLEWVGASVDPATRTVRSRVVVPNPQRLLRPGMFARVRVELGDGPDGVWLPSQAVVADGPQRFVFVRLGPRRFIRRDVQVGPALGDRVPVLAGLQPGEEVAVRGAFLLKSDVLREKMGAGCAD